MNLLIPNLDSILPDSISFPKRGERGQQPEHRRLLVLDKRHLLCALQLSVRELLR